MMMRPILRRIFLGSIGLALSLPVAVAQQPVVKSVELKNFKLLEESPEQLTLLKQDFKEYDPVGRLLRHILHNISPSGDLVLNVEINKTWNDIGLLEEINRYDEQGMPLRIEKVQYDKKNKKLKEEYIEPMVDMDKTFIKTYTYTETGKPNKHTLTDQTGKLIGEETWKYNEDNEEIRYHKWEMRGTAKYEEEKKTYYTKDGKLDKAEKEIKDGKDVLKEVTTFDGYKIKETIKYKNGEVVSQFNGNGGGGTAKYDPSKAKTMMEFGGGNGGGGFGGGFGGGGFGSMSMAFDVQEETDDQGRKIKTTEYDANGEVIQLTIYEYDEHGNTTKIKTEAYMNGEVTSSNEEITEFDDKNNLIRKAVILNGFTMSEDTYAYQYHE